MVITFLKFVVCIDVNIEAASHTSFDSMKIIIVMDTNEDYYH